MPECLSVSETDITASQSKTIVLHGVSINRKRLCGRQDFGLRNVNEHQNERDGVRNRVNIRRQT